MILIIRLRLLFFPIKIINVFIFQDNRELLFLISDLIFLFAHIVYHDKTVRGVCVIFTFLDEGMLAEDLFFREVIIKTNYFIQKLVEHYIHFIVASEVHAPIHNFFEYFAFTNLLSNCVPIVEAHTMVFDGLNEVQMLWIKRHLDDHGYMVILASSDRAHNFARRSVRLEEEYVSRLCQIYQNVLDNVQW